jgi:hypothetical protein
LRVELGEIGNKVNCVLEKKQYYFRPKGVGGVLFGEVRKARVSILRWVKVFAFD